MRASAARERRSGMDSSASTPTRSAFPELAAEFERRVRGELPAGWPEIVRKLYRAGGAKRPARWRRVSARSRR